MKDTTEIVIKNKDYKSNDEAVSHPQHYKTGGMEAIDVIQAFTSELNGIEAVDTGNALKYIMRWKRKTESRILKRQSGILHISRTI